MKTRRRQKLLAATLVGALTATAAHAQTAELPYKFERGYPTTETVQKAYDDADLNRAIQAYRFSIRRSRLPDCSGVSRTMVR